MTKIVLSLLAVAAAFTVAVPANAGWVNGYYKQNGTYVQPYLRSNPNGTCWDNYGGC